MSNPGGSVTDDLYSNQSPREGEGRYSGMTKDGGPKRTTIGRARPLYDARKVRYDFLDAAVKAPVRWHVDKDDVMPAMQVGDTWSRLYAIYGIERESAAILHAFTDAVLFFHSVNSGSTLQPGRSAITLYIGEEVKTFYAYDLITFLGADLRRFFRGQADEIRQLNKKVLSAVDPFDLESQDRRDWLLRVAAERNLQRAPDLCHDSADCCTLLPGERALITASQKSVFSSVINSVDRFRGNPRQTTSDDFDSTNLVTVPNKSTAGN